jgi:hypothetical protein
VLASTQDVDAAWETSGEDGLMHGAFTWAWIRAMRDAAAGEAAQDTFLRAQARLRAERPYQAPVMLGLAAARLRPFLRARIDRKDARAIVAVERVASDGSIVLQGGWANGLAVGTELRVVDDRTATPRLRIASILGLGRSTARIAVPGRALPQAIRSGALLEVVGWAAPAGRPLRVWMPPGTSDVRRPAKFAKQLAAAGKGRWLSDPVDTTPTHVLRPRGTGWELLDREGGRTELTNESTAVAAIARLRPNSSLFAQLPVPSALVGAIAVGRGMDHEGIAIVDDAKEADYILAGRYHRGRLQYAWVRPLVCADDRRDSALPQRTSWGTADAALLRASVLKLRRIHAWQLLESPPESPAPYRLALWREKTGELVRDRAVFGGDTYSVVLRAQRPPAPPTTPRYYYAFVIDCHGKSYLVFPESGSVENRFPIRDPAPADIPLGASSAFDVTLPYGVDTYFLLSTEEPLPNPSILEWDGVRAPVGTHPLTALEQLLLQTTTGTRSGRTLATSGWSIERVALESVGRRRR